MKENQNFKQSLMGIFEISIFMEKGFQRFENSAKSAMHSFIWPAITIPMALIVSIALSQGYSFSLLFILHSIRIISAFLLSLLLAFAFSKQLKRQNHFLKFLTIFNWFEVVMLALISPALILLTLGTPLEQIETYAVFVMLVGYLYSAYIITHSLRVPWQLGGFVSISFLFIDETTMKIMTYIRDILSGT